MTWQYRAQWFAGSQRNAWSAPGQPRGGRAGHRLQPSSRMKGCGLWALNIDACGRPAKLFLMEPPYWSPWGDDPPIGQHLFSVVAFFVFIFIFGGVVPADVDQIHVSTGILLSQLSCSKQSNRLWLRPPRCSCNHLIGDTALPCLSRSCSAKCWPLDGSPTQHAYGLLAAMVLRPSVANLAYHCNSELTGHLSRIGLLWRR